MLCGMTHSTVFVTSFVQCIHVLFRVWLFGVCVMVCVISAHSVPRQTPQMELMYEKLWLCRSEESTALSDVDDTTQRTSFV